MTDNRSDEFEGATVDTPSETFELASQIRTGINGRLYGTESADSKLVKIFDESVREEAKAKIRTMVDKPPRDPTQDKRDRRSIVWPEEAVEDSSSGSFLGYSMRYDRFDSGENALRYAMARLRWEKSSPTDRYTPALNLAITVYALHEQGYALGDFHHENVHLDDGYVTLVECDTFYIPDHSSDARIDSNPSRRNPYSATENSGDKKASNDESRAYNATRFQPRYTVPSDSLESLSEVRTSDRFSLSVHIFQLLMEGHHPYLVEGNDAAIGDWSDMIQENPFPYTHSGSDIRPHDKAPDYSRLPSEVQELFERCFSESGKRNVESRPTPREWIETFVGLVQERTPDRTKPDHSSGESNAGVSEDAREGIGIINRHVDIDGVGGSGRKLNPREWIDLLQERFSLLETPPETEEANEETAPKEGFEENPYEDNGADETGATEE